MTKKRLLLIAALPLAFALTFGVLALIPSGPGVTKANFDRIHVGMTMAEVEEIFGEKGTAWDTTGEVAWMADDGSVATIAVHEYSLSKHWRYSNESFFDKLRRLLLTGMAL